MGIARPSLDVSPQTLGRFEVLKAIGEGSQGIVYLAEDPDLLRLVTVKMLSNRPGLGSQLVEEARSLSRLDHPNIVSLLEFGEHEEIPYLVYEFVDGRSLRSRLDAKPQPAIDQALRWTGQILAGVHCAHGSGIVHGDLNPTNVMIDQAGNARIMDFGMTFTAPGHAGGAETLSNRTLYQAPEQTSGRSTGPGIDIFAAGLMLLEMLTGKHPLGSAGHLRASADSAHNPFPSVTEILPELTGPWDSIIKRALEVAPSDRFSSALEMREAIQDMVAARADAMQTDASSHSTFTFLLRRMRRHSDFPTISDQIVEISKKTSNPEHTSVSDLANTILNDYALTTKLLKLVNSSFYGQYGGKISTVSRAVVILGFKQVRMAAQSLLLFDHLRTGAHADEIRDAAGTAQMGGILAHTLAGRLRMKEPEEAFVCGMLRTLGRFLTMYYLPEEFADIGHAVRTQGLDESSACRQVLGLTYERLGIGIAREWQLPSVIVSSLSELPDGPVEPPVNAMQRLQTVAAFSSAVAETMATGDAEQLEALQAKYANALPVDTESLKSLVSDALASARSYGPILNEKLERCRAFKQVERWLEGATDAHPGALADADDASVVGPLPGDPRSHAIMNGIQDITHAMVEGYSLNDVLVMILETIYRGLNCTRVVLCIHDRKRHEVVARFGLGLDLDNLKPRFRFVVDKETTLQDAFTRAVLEHEDVLYSSSNTPRDVLPAWYRRLITPDTAVVLPIVIRDVCFGLIYCDQEQSTTPISGTDMNYLNTLRNQATLAIKQQTR